MVNASATREPRSIHYGNPDNEPAALQMIVRAIGNSVLRLESCSLVPMDAALEWKALYGLFPLAFPLPVDLLDVASVAIEALGIPASRHKTTVPQGYARALADDLTEILVWRSPLDPLDHRRLGDQDRAGPGV